MLLLIRNPVGAGCFGPPRNGNTAFATGFIRSAGMMLSLKGVRLVVLPPANVPVSGSKIVTTFLKAEKSPFARAAVGAQMLFASKRGRESLMLSYEKKKKVLFFPL